MKRRLILIGFFLGVGAAPVFSFSLNDLIDSKKVRVLLDQGTITEVQLKAPQLLLVPWYPFIQNLLNRIMGDLEPTFFVETLRLYKKPPGSALPVWSDGERKALFNGILALSTLRGIQYYSSTRKTMRTFYETSMVIDGPDTKQPLEDPIYREPPREAVVYARQKDLTFGDNIYQYTYYALPDSLVFIQQNYTSLTVGIIPAVGKDKLRSVVAVIDAGEYLLVYLASMAKAASFPGMNQQVGKSFSTRADAILQWFTAQADKAFAATRLNP
jgi:hypothetical protein